VKLLAEPEPAAGGRLKSRIKGDPKVRNAVTQTTSSSEEVWRRHEDETKEILVRISTVEGNLRSAQGFDDPFWNQVDLEAALGYLKKLRECLTVLRQPTAVRSKLPPPPKKKPA